MEKTKNSECGYSIIHEEYLERESEARCFKRHEITRKQWELMTSKDSLKWWKARGIIRTYTPLGYKIIGHSRRRWGDNVKVIDRWNIVPTGTEYTPKNIYLDDLIRGNVA